MKEATPDKYQMANLRQHVAWVKIALHLMTEENWQAMRDKIMQDHVSVIESIIMRPEYD